MFKAVGLLATALPFVFSASLCVAAENGTGFYVLGSRLPGVGFTPPPGLYSQNDVLLYSGSAGSNVELPLAGTIAAGIDASAWIDLPTLILATDVDVFGGRLGFMATTPFGSQSIKAFVGPFEVSDSITTFGDPVITGFVGWSSSNFHWQTGVAVNVPIGDYNEGGLANLAIHRWAADFYGSLTWLNPATGLQIDNSAGFTFNGKNQDTDYRTGTEFHWEGAVSQNFANGIAAGIAGYYYRQISGDSGPGAVLGDFEGQVAAIGAFASYNFKVGELPVTARLKYFHEFDVENRLKADTGFLTIAFPLSVQGP